MKNNLFPSRCETVLITMRSGNFKSITTKQVAKWLEMESAVVPFMAKMVQYNLLKKVGSASKTCYQLTNECHNSLEREIQSKGNVNQAVTYVVNWFMKHPVVKAKEVITENGKKFAKIQNIQDLDEEANSAINQMMTVVNQNKDLRAENQLLKEEIERLKFFEERYNQIKALIK